MAAKNTAKRTSKISKNKVFVGGKRGGPSSSYRKLTAITFVLLFAVIGTIVLIRSLAATLTPTGDVLATYTIERPSYARTINAATGEKIWISYSSTYLVQRDGVLICDDGNPQGVVKTGVLSKGYVDKMKSEIEALNTKSLPLRSDVAAANGAPTPSATINNFEGFLFAGATTVDRHAIMPGAPKSDKLVQMQNKILAACAKADKTYARQQKKAFKFPHAQARLSVSQKIARLFMPRANATATAPEPTYPPVSDSTDNSHVAKQSTVIVPPPATAPPAPAPTTVSSPNKWDVGTLPFSDVDGTYEAQMLGYINDYRIGNNRGQLQVYNCIPTVARNWSKYQADTATLAHNPAFTDQVKTQCGKDFAQLGEIVGYQTPVPTVWSNVGKIFETFKASPAHNDAMLSPEFGHIGVGSYTNPNTHEIYLTVNFTD